MPRRALFTLFGLALGLSLGWVDVGSWAEPPSALPAGTKLEDWRLRPLQDYNGYFPFDPPKTQAEWSQRRAHVRRQLKVALGLWPLPKKTPLNPVIHGRRDLGDYSIEKVYFESLPGFYATGSLYRPKSDQGHERKRRPGVLSPHGHWSRGRFHDHGPAGVKRELETGGEQHAEGGRSPLQARCVHLARMGAVVFHYDMLGYADNQQISHEVAHRFGEPRPEMNTRKNWGLYSAQAEARLQTVMGLQAWNSIRALDFLESLPDVDPRRIGVTGASGGGTQTFILGAIDDRPAAAFPAVMVSTAMQGGCTCENASLLRIETGNVEIAGLFAPKPLGMTAADDWTKEMATQGFPELKQLYRLYDAEDNVSLAALTQFKHNYNARSRAAMYAWFAKHLGLQDVKERPYKRLTAEELTVWGAEHPRPPGGDDYERKLVRQWTERSERQMARLVPRDAESLETYRKVVGSAVDVIVGRGLPSASDLSYAPSSKQVGEEVITMAGLLTHRLDADRVEQTPLMFLYPREWNRQVVLWLDSRGKSALLEDDGPPTAAIRELLQAGVCVVGVDLWGQGELAPGKPLTKNPQVPNPRQYAGYTYGYNASMAIRQTHNALAALAFVRKHERSPERIALVSLDPALTPTAALTAAQAGGALDAAAIATDGFRFAQLTDWRDPRFVPGGAKYGDVPGILALFAPQRLLLLGEQDAPDLTHKTYRSANAREALSWDTGNGGRVVKWLLEANGKSKP